jgi:hypothetical protein
LSSRAFFFSLFSGKRLQDAQESNEVCFLLRRQVKLKDEVEKLNRVFQREQSPVV